MPQNYGRNRANIMYFGIGAFERGTFRPPSFGVGLWVPISFPVTNMVNPFLSYLTGSSLSDTMTNNAREAIAATDAPERTKEDLLT